MAKPKPTEIHNSKAQVGDQVAVAKDGTGLAWDLADVERNPDRYEWPKVTGRWPVNRGGGLILDKGGPGLNGPNVIVLR